MSDSERDTATPAGRKPNPEPSGEHPKPIAEDRSAAFTVGETLRGRVVDVAFGGEAVVKMDDFVFFVPFSAVGEEIEFEVLELKKSFGRGRLTRVVTPSPDRVEPKCRHFGECGGCQYQHLSYPAQLRIKHKQITDLFQRVGGFKNVVIDPVVASPAEYGYRNRIMVRSQWNKRKQGLEIGFIRHDNNWVVSVEECPIAEPEVSAGIRGVHENPPPKGGLKVVIRKFPDDWEVPRDSFFQNNFHLLPKLVETVGNRLRDGGSRFLLDVYCGVGFFGISLASLVERFAGIEADKPAIHAAEENLRRRGIQNGEFIRGEAQALLPQMLQRFPAGATTVLLDPPRTGCDKASMELLRSVRPRQILYISCHPATLARDLNVLCGEGVYELARVTPLDMFPQTQHVECVADVRLVE